MKCPFCTDSDTKVVDKRETGTKEAITRRRRECLKCQKRFTTYERVEDLDLMVIKRNNRLEPYNREKLKAGLLKACEKRPVSEQQIEKIIDEIESKMRSHFKKQIPSKKIGDLMINKLKKLDKVAYLRFISVYNNFKDVGDFEKEIKSLKR